MLQAQAQWMIGHRMPECSTLLEDVQEKIKQVFNTKQPVFISASSGTSLQEAAIRNCTDQKVLNCVNGAFADRWRRVTEANGKRNEILEVEWGKPILPEPVFKKLGEGGFDAVTIVHNETSTGVISPINEITQMIRSLPRGEDILILVDSVSGIGGAELKFDEWDLDVVLTSSQKALALPPGLAFCAVSDRALEKARNVQNRGYYLDFLQLEKYHHRNQTPFTPAISLIFALDLQLTRILEEGLTNRFERHLTLRNTTISWAQEQGFTLFAEERFESPTVSCINNNLQVDLDDLNSYLRSQGMIVSNGYGLLKGKNFRIAHMGDLSEDELDGLLNEITEFMTKEIRA